MSDSRRVAEPPDGAGPWSDVRHEYMSARDVQRFREIAGLEPDEAVLWWETYVFPGEAAKAIANGLTPDEAVKLRQRERAERDIARREESERREQEARERARQEREADARREEDARRRVQALSKRFETELGVVLIVRSSEADSYRLRRSTDAHWHLERFDPEARELVDDCPDVAIGIERLTEHLENENRAAVSATVVGGMPVSPLRLLQPLRPVVSSEFTLNGRKVSVVASIALRQMLTPTEPENWPDHRTVTKRVSAVGDLYLIKRANGELVPLGFFESDTAARTDPGWPHETS